MTAWILTCNPSVFKIGDFRRDGQVLESWSVGRYLDQIAEGDQFALWLTGRSGGVIAYGRITGKPSRGAPNDAAYWTDPPADRVYVPVEVDEWLEHIVPKRLLLTDPRLSGASIWKQSFAANPHTLDENQWAAITEAIDAVRGDDPDWDLQPGDEIRRVDLHKKYGGSTQNGISPCASTDNILIFTAASSGQQHGYYDKWDEDGTLHYTGDGQQGDQRMIRGNKAIFQHWETGKRLRLFEGAGGTVRYLGEWVLNPERPYSEGEAHATGGGGPRKVIRFHLVPVRSASHNPAVGIGQAYVAPDETVQPAPPAPSAPDPDLMGRNLTTHRRLQNALAREAQDRGLEALSPSLSDPSFDFAWRDPTGCVTVCEVKSLRPSNEVQQLRTGLGQILDYHDQLTGRGSEVRAVLWIEREPSDPRWTAMCQRVGVALAWPGLEDMIFELPSTSEEATAGAEGSQGWHHHGGWVVED